MCQTTFSFIKNDIQWINPLNWAVHCKKSFGGFHCMLLTTPLQSSICDVKFSQMEGYYQHFRHIERSNSVIS